MKNLSELKKHKEDQLSQLFEGCGVFFAFSDKQFEENKKPLPEGDKYATFANGAFCFKSKYTELVKGFDTIDKEFEKSVNDNSLRKSAILYELQNYEAFYTNDIEDTLEALGEGYTAQEVWEVFNENKEVVYARN